MGQRAWSGVERFAYAVGSGCRAPAPGPCPPFIDVVGPRPEQHGPRIGLQILELALDTVRRGDVVLIEARYPFGLNHPEADVQGSGLSRVALQGDRGDAWVLIPRRQPGAVIAR